MGYDKESLASRLRSRLQQGHSIAIVGWKEKNHDPTTLALKESGRFVFYERPPMIDGFPKAISFAIGTNNLDTVDFSSLRAMGTDSVNAKVATPDIREVLAKVRTQVIKTSPGAIEEAARTRKNLEELPDVPSIPDDTNNQPEEPELPAKKAATNKPRTGRKLREATSKEVGFAKRFCALAKQYKGEVPSKITRGVVGRFFGPNVIPAHRPKLIQGLVVEGNKNATLYAPTPYLLTLVGEEAKPEPKAKAPKKKEVSVNAVLATPSEEPTEPFARAQWLIDNLEYFQVQKKAYDELITRAKNASQLLSQMRNI